MDIKPTPENTIVISFRWIFIGAAMALFMWALIEKLGWLRGQTGFIREAILYIPLFVLGLVSQVASIFRAKLDDRKLFIHRAEIHLSSLLGFLIEIPLRPVVEAMGLLPF